MVSKIIESNLKQLNSTSDIWEDYLRDIRKS